MLKYFTAQRIDRADRMGENTRLVSRFLLAKLIVTQILKKFGYGLDDWGSGVRLRAGAGNFSLLHRIQTGFGVYPASYPIGIGDLYPEAK
jgi:hypothetical protein